MATVLVVDDEDDIRELVRLNLELDGHVVVTAASGEEALAQVVDEMPDVVVLDLMMPEVDGWEVLSRMKAEAAHVATIPVVLLTARTDDMDRIRGGIEGAIRYITKPFSLADLRKEVRRALEGDPEPVKRRRAQQGALEELARMERGDRRFAATAAPRPRLTRLESSAPQEPTVPRPSRTSPTAMGSLSPKQAELLAMVSGTPTVREAAERLEVSRSNVYASLRRIARKLDVSSVPELVAMARQGVLRSPDAD